MQFLLRVCGGFPAKIAIFSEGLLFCSNKEKGGFLSSYPHRIGLQANGGFVLIMNLTSSYNSLTESRQWHGSEQLHFAKAGSQQSTVVASTE